MFDLEKLIIVEETSLYLYFQVQVESLWWLVSLQLRITSFPASPVCCSCWAIMRIRPRSQMPPNTCGYGGFTNTHNSEIKAVLLKQPFPHWTRFCCPAGNEGRTTCIIPHSLLGQDLRKHCQIWLPLPPNFTQSKTGNWGKQKDKGYEKEKGERRKEKGERRKGKGKRGKEKEKGKGKRKKGKGKKGKGRKEEGRGRKGKRLRTASAA